MELDGAGPVLLELLGRFLRLVSGRAGQHFQGLATAAGWLARSGGRGKALKAMRQLDVDAAWVRHATAPKSDELVEAVSQLLDLLTGDEAGEAITTEENLKEVDEKGG